jgi:hypothetical protein
VLLLCLYCLLRTVPTALSSTTVPWWLR